MVTSVVNIHKKERCDIYIGRTKDDPMHFGNPYSLGKSAITSLSRPDRYTCLLAFHDWITGRADISVEPERRAWIWDNLDLLKGKKLGCFCHPLVCHGDIYRVLLGEITLEEVLEPIRPKPKAPEPDQVCLF